LLSQDLDKLDKFLSERAETRLVIFDPLSAYFGVRDSHRDADVRQVLGPLGDLAAKHNVTVLGITHLSKNTGVSALARFMGSTGIIAASRAAYMAVRHGDQNLLLPVKNNLAPLGRGLVYDIKNTTIRDSIETSFIEWTGETDIEADEVLAVVQQRTSSPALHDAKAFLKDQLKNGPKRQVDIEAAAELEKDKFSVTTVKRAKKELGIQSRKDRFTSGWKWYTKEQFLLMKSQDPKQLGTLRKDQGCQEPEFGTLGGKNAAKKAPKVNGDNGSSDSTEGCQTMEKIGHSEASKLTKDAKSRAWHPSDEKKVLL
jgi:putative DNA primase/helicase